jgi:hypothetical protein
MTSILRARISFRSFCRSGRSVEPPEYPPASRAKAQKEGSDKARPGVPVESSYTSLLTTTPASPSPANEKKRSATTFLRAAVAYYASLGVKIQRVMSDNGACYKSFAFRRVCKQLGLRHIRTRPDTPKDQWQSRTLHPDFLARMGLCPGLSKLKSATLVPARLAAFLQLASPSCRHR